jgi:hypothetical protein
MHEIKIRVLHKVYKQAFKQLYSTIVPRLAKTRVNPHEETIEREQASGHELRYEMKWLRKLSKLATSIKTSISSKRSIHKNDRYHLKVGNNNLRCTLCQMLTYATKKSVCTSE